MPPAARKGSSTRHHVSMWCQIGRSCGYTRFERRAWHSLGCGRTQRPRTSTCVAPQAGRTIRMSPFGKVRSRCIGQRFVLGAKAAITSLKGCDHRLTPSHSLTYLLASADQTTVVPLYVCNNERYGVRGQDTHTHTHLQPAAPRISSLCFGSTYTRKSAALKEGTKSSSYTP